jgi:hypothetical protein
MVQRRWPGGRVEGSPVLCPLARAGLAGPKCTVERHSVENITSGRAQAAHELVWNEIDPEGAPVSCVGCRMLGVAPIWGEGEGGRWSGRESWTLAGPPGRRGRGTESWTWPSLWRVVSPKVFARSGEMGDRGEPGPG